MIISVKTKSISKLLEATINAENYHKELDKKDKSRRTQTPAPSTSKGKKKEEVFNIHNSKAPRKAQDPKNEAAREGGIRKAENVEEIFKTLLEHGKLELPPSKRPNQEGRLNDPNYCPYHRDEFSSFE